MRHALSTFFRPRLVVALVATAALAVPGAAAGRQAAVLTLSPPSLPDATANVDYTQSITASGGVAPYTFAVTAGSLPPGFFLSEGGLLFGRTTSKGSFSFTVTASDSGGGSSGSRAYTLTVAPNPLSVTPSQLPDATLGVPYDSSLSTTGGTPPYTYSLIGGSLPTGITFDSSGRFGGTPKTVGGAVFAISVVDAVGRSFTGYFSLSTTGAGGSGSASGALNVTPATLPGGTAGVSYDQTVSASGGTEPYTFGLASGKLPDGLSLSSDGKLSGTPTKAGTFTFALRATDSANRTGTRSYSVVIAPPKITLAPATLPGGNRGSPYNAVFSASGGTGPYSFAVSGGALPAGLALESSGVLGGAPTEKGDFPLTVTATDKNGATGSATYTLSVGGALLVFAPAVLPFPATANVFYSQPLAVSGGTGPYVFTLTGGSLPAGLTLDSAGVLSGIPDAGAGYFTFTVTAVDANGDPASKTYTVRLATSHLLLTPLGLPTATRGLRYRQSFATDGGSGPYSYSLERGKLPPGVSLGSSGVLGGVPSAVGRYRFTVRVSDANGAWESEAYGITVNAKKAAPRRAVVQRVAVKRKRR